jgi:ABC-type bacteriocin/lantibiotic exporter with double-glycine peptidase domain
LGSVSGAVSAPRPPELSLWEGLWRLYRHLSRRRRLQLTGVFGLSVIGALAELATIGAVLPFLALMADPTLTARYSVVRSTLTSLGWSSEKSIFFHAAALFICMALVVGAVRTVLTWAVFRFTFGIGADLGKEIYRRTLLQPYSYHIARNSSETLANLTMVQSVIGGVVNPLMQSAVAGLFVIAIAMALLAASALASILTALTFVAIYGIISLVTRQELNRNSKVIAEMETQRVQAIQEGLGGVRDVIIDGTQNVFVNRYWAYEARQRRAQAVTYFLSYAPRYLIESLGMIVIAMLALWLSTRAAGLSGALPILGALALGAQRALPQIQLIYFGWASMNASKAALGDVVTILELPVPAGAPVAETDRLRVERSINLEEVSFRYVGDGPEVLSRINLTIERGARIGLVGKTGSGKSTLADLIMGLLEPTHGHIRIDGKPLTAANRGRWQAAIAHVPQAIYLADATIAENIAFGQDPQSVDRKRIREAAERAKIASFVDSLPNNFDTIVGERGVRLSGGQRQRIGLARAFYKRANIVIMDEATSALDSETEAVVMNGIYASGRDTTVLIVAHRLTTLRTCDRIVELNDGKIVRECHYQDLAESEADLMPTLKGEEESQQLSRSF